MIPKCVILYKSHVNSQERKANTARYGRKAGTEISGDDHRARGASDLQTGGPLHYQHAHHLVLQHGGYLLRGHAEEQCRHRRCGCGVLHDGYYPGHWLFLRPRQRQLHLPGIGQAQPRGCLQHGRHRLFLRPGIRPADLCAGSAVSGASGLSAWFHGHHFTLCQGLSAGHPLGCSVDDGLSGAE